MNTLSRFILGEFAVLFRQDEAGHTGLTLIPADMEADLAEKKCAVESLVQLHLRGDALPHGFANGATLADTPSTNGLRLSDQRREGDAILTELRDQRGIRVRHRLRWHAGLQAVILDAEVINETGRPVTLDMLSSFSIGMLTPFAPDDAPGGLTLHRVKSAWSEEGRLLSQGAEELNLEPAWIPVGVRVEKFGQLGSMPVRGYFPFAAVEDTRRGVTWAAQLAIPSSWQMEFRRRDGGLSLTGGLADAEYGHWAKELPNGASFLSPPAYLTVARGGVDEASQMLLTVQRENWVGKDRPLPVLFNEYCTTWGKPSHDNLMRIAQALQGRGVDYLVIDAGWYGASDRDWSACGGDWLPDERGLFPRGLAYTAQRIRDAGMIPGLWFEPETCARQADIFRQEDRLLHRNGVVIDTDNRRFLDLRTEENQAYLRQRVAGLLKKCHFGYVKIDYNDTIGVGCDGCESLGEGLRQNMLGAQRFFRMLRQEIPDLVIENCSSGGHRLEPSMMALSDMASFSDAHECAHIPIIAAALQRMILAGQSQIWAVLRQKDDLRRINYSLVNTLLGVMCLSGDIFSLSEAQWRKVEEGIAFYRRVGLIIRDGVSRFYGSVSPRWLHPEGWQAVVRAVDGGEALVVIHTFGGPLPPRISLPVPARLGIAGVLCSENDPVSLQENCLTVIPQANFEAVAIHLAKTGRDESTK
ncbi:MAG: alpha-galactosidase [Clostridia bacterium]|nr:alpha-galactosidase [Clostridia bacterium]